MLLRPGDMRLRDEHSAIARRLEWAHEAAHAHRHCPGYYAELASTKPSSIALRKKGLVSRETEEAPTQRSVREIAGGATTADRRTKQHDPARRKYRCTRGATSRGTIEQCKNDQAAQAVTDQVQTVRSQSSEKQLERASVLGKACSDRRITER